MPALRRGLQGDLDGHRRGVRHRQRRGEHQVRDLDRPFPPGSVHGGRPGDLQEGRSGKHRAAGPHPVLIEDPQARRVEGGPVDPGPVDAAEHGLQQRVGDGDAPPGSGRRKGRDRHTDLLPGRPADGARGHPLRGQTLGQGVQVGVGRHVVDLARWAEEGAHGREEDDEIRRAVASPFCQGQRGADLGAQHGIHLLTALRLERGIVDGAGGVQDPADLTEARLHVRECGAKRGGRGHVDGKDADLGARLLDGPDSPDPPRQGVPRIGPGEYAVPLPAVGQAGAGQQDESAPGRLRRSASQVQRESAQAAGDHDESPFAEDARGVPFRERHLLESWNEAPGRTQRHPRVAGLSLQLGDEPSGQGRGIRQIGRGVHEPAPRGRELHRQHQGGPADQRLRRMARGRVPGGLGPARHDHQLEVLDRLLVDRGLGQGDEWVEEVLDGTLQVCGVVVQPPEVDDLAGPRRPAERAQDRGLPFPTGHPGAALNDVDGVPGLLELSGQLLADSSLVREDHHASRRPALRGRARGATPLAAPGPRAPVGAPDHLCGAGPREKEPVPGLDPVTLVVEGVGGEADAARGRHHRVPLEIDACHPGATHRTQAGIQVGAGVLGVTQDRDHRVPRAEGGMGPRERGESLARADLEQGGARA